MLISPIVKRITGSLLISFLLAIIWVYATRDMYSYNTGFQSVFSLNVFPLTLWTLMLTVGYLLAEFLQEKFGMKQFLPRFLFVIILYITAVIILETFGYHVLGIQNLGTSGYAGLPICDCLHAPVWMQIGYLLLGPLHWLILQLARYLQQLHSTQP